MGDNPIYQELDQYYVPNDQKPLVQKSQKNQKTKIVSILLIIIFTVLGLELFLYFFVYPLATAAEVKFEGLNRLEEEDLLKKSSALFSQPWAKLDEETVTAFFYDNPLIDTVVVKKKFPNYITVIIEERVPVVVAIAQTNDKSIPISIDKKGVVFQIGGALTEGLPLLSGLNFESVQIGMRVHANIRPLLEKLATVLEKNPAFLKGISEIQILPKDYGDYDLA
ncbi:MAG: cell division protein FtsQ/DivIB, partial [Treponemataceae bacterium]